MKQRGTPLKLVDANITAKASTWSPEWSAGFKNGTFAATFCPSWMTGIVADNSGPGEQGQVGRRGRAGWRR